ncbi:Rhodanese-like domain-containing protein [Hyaloraphidium curvatum]|nr:Rhodanese-like domain-containing protein [Hyaloraphidium curvatum]
MRFPGDGGGMLTAGFSPDVPHSPLQLAGRRKLELASPTPVVEKPMAFPNRTMRRHFTADVSSLRAPLDFGAVAPRPLAPTVCMSPLEDEFNPLGPGASTAPRKESASGLFPSVSSSGPDAKPPPADTQHSSEVANKARNALFGTKAARSWHRQPAAVKPPLTRTSNTAPTALPIPQVSVRPTTKPPLPGSPITFLPSPTSDEDVEPPKAQVAPDFMAMDWAADSPVRQCSVPVQESAKRRREDEHSPPSKNRRTHSVPAMETCKEPAPLPREAPPILPYIPTGASDGIRRIAPETVIDLLNGHYSNMCDDFHIIDCRFDYEFEGGHIRGARNIHQEEQILEVFLRGSIVRRRTVIVFHCEFSSHRAPRMAKVLRNEDRMLNLKNYPELHYPDVYVLEGGYKGFFEKYKEHCDPQAYVQMANEAHLEQCRQARREFKKVRSYRDAQKRDRL